MRPTLTVSAIRAAAPGTILWDDEVRGLHLRVTESRRTFYFYYRTKAGVERRPKLDEFGVLTLAQARDLAREIRNAVAAGRDPGAERTLARAEPTVAEFIATCIEKHWRAKRRRKTADEVDRLFDKHVTPRIGSEKVSAVNFDMVADLHARMRKTPYQANRVVRHLSKLFSLAERPYKHRPLHSNPCTGVEAYPEQSRRRHASPAEFARIGPLLDAAAKDNAQSVAFIYIQLYSGARPDEVAKARWVQLDGNVLRMHDTKTGYRDVYLPEQAMAVINTLPRTSGPIVGIKSPTKLWQRIRKDAGCPDLRLYDLRRSFASVALRSGQSVDVIGQLLGHKQAQTTLVYARLMEDAAQDAAATTAKAVENLLRGESA